MNDDNAALESAISAFQSGHMGEAEDFAQLVLLQDPDQPDALHLLGLIAVQAEELDVAADLLNRAYEAAEGHPGIAVNLAAVLGRVGRATEQAEVCRSAIQKAPENGDLWNNLGLALQAEGDGRGAVASFEKAHELAADDMDSLLNLAEAYAQTDQPSAAVAAYAQVLDVLPDDTEAGVGLAMAQAAQGKTDAASVSYRRVLSTDPANVEVLFQLADAGAMRGDEAATATALLSGSGLEDDDRARLHFALGAYNAENDSVQAFSHYEDANALRAAQGSAQGRAFDPDAFDAYVDGLIETFTPAWFAAHAGQGASSDRPVFIIGMPCSGGDRLERILKAHSQGAAGGELGVFHSLSGLTQAARALKTETIEDIGAWHEGRLSKISTLAARVSDLTPVNFLCLGIIAAVFPNATIVHAKRDALATGLACFLHDFSDPQPWSVDMRLAGRYIRAYERLMAHWHAVLPVAMLDMDFDAMGTAPDEEVGRFLGAIGLAADEACLGAVGGMPASRLGDFGDQLTDLQAGLNGDAVSRGI